MCEPAIFEAVEQEADRRIQQLGHNTIGLDVGKAGGQVPPIRRDIRVAPFADHGVVPAVTDPMQHSNGTEFLTVTHESVKFVTVLNMWSPASKLLGHVPVPQITGFCYMRVRRDHRTESR